MEFLHQAKPGGICTIEKQGTWLPLEIYKAVRPYIEEIVEKENRPVSYPELHDHLFEVIGSYHTLSRAQIGGHISRSKKLARFKMGDTIYVVSQRTLDKFMAGNLVEVELDDAAI